MAYSTTHTRWRYGILRPYPVNFCKNGKYFCLNSGNVDHHTNFPLWKFFGYVQTLTLNTKLTGLTLEYRRSSRYPKRITFLLSSLYLPLLSFFYIFLPLPCPPSKTFVTQIIINDSFWKYLLNITIFLEICSFRLFLSEKNRYFCFHVLLGCLLTPLWTLWFPTKLFSGKRSSLRSNTSRFQS